MKYFKLLAMVALSVAPLGAVAKAESPDDIGACWQTHRFGPSQTQCNVVERQYCIGSLTISARFIKGGDCSE